MKLKTLLYLPMILVGVALVGCSDTEAPKENHALQLYQESSTHLQNVFQSASKLELGIFNLDSAIVTTELSTLENSVDAAVTYWENEAPAVDSSDAFKMACLNWVSFYGLSVDTYQLAYDSATADSMTASREQYIRRLLGDIATQDAAFKTKYEAERDALLARNNIILN